PAQSLALPVTLVEIQHPAGFLREICVAAKNPTAMLPRSNRVGIKPAPYRGTADLRHNATIDRLPYQSFATEPRKWQSARRGKLTGHRLDLHDNLRGENRADARCEVRRATPPCADQRSVCATC